MKRFITMCLALLVGSGCATSATLVPAPTQALVNLEFGIGEQPSRYLLNIGGKDVLVTGILWVMTDGIIMPSFVEGYVDGPNGQMPSIILPDVTGTSVPSLYNLPQVVKIGGLRSVTGITLGTNETGHLVFKKVIGVDASGVSKVLTNVEFPVINSQPCTGYTQRSCTALFGCATCTSVGDGCRCTSGDGAGQCGDLTQTWCSGDCPYGMFCNGSGGSCSCEKLPGVGGDCPACPPNNGSNPEDGPTKDAQFDDGYVFPNQQPQHDGPSE
jgi:hypothetical protein